MKISRNWLQQHFEQPLPDAETLSTALTFHAFEIDGVENAVAAEALRKAGTKLPVKTKIVARI
jgi:hypothetical protein